MSGRVIDLRGPTGNAFASMGRAVDLLRQLNRRDEVHDLRTEMMAGDYTNLLRIFEENFGDYVELINKPGEDDGKRT